MDLAVECLDRSRPEGSTDLTRSSGCASPDKNPNGDSSLINYLAVFCNRSLALPVPRLRLGRS